MTMNRFEARMTGEIQGLVADGNLEGALRLLRDGGCSKVQSIFELAATGSFSLAEAKVAVHNSGVWSDVHQRDSDFHDRLEAAIEEWQLPRDD